MTTVNPAGSSRREEVDDPPGFERYLFPDGDGTGSTFRRHVLRRGGRGPVVIVIHELPGITAKTVGLATAILDRGYTVVMPVLLPSAGERSSTTHALRNLRAICVTREFAALARAETGEVVDWLRALAAHEEERAARSGVGVVGMCFSGSFALAMVLDPRVRAAVVSQPSLPFSCLPGRWADLGVSTGDLDRISRRASAGFRIRALRYQRDAQSPRARLDRIAAMDNSSTCEIPTPWPWKHSVLSDSLRARSGTQLAAALTETLDYLETNLPVDG